MNIRRQIEAGQAAQSADAEAGFMLVFVVVLVALVLIALSVAAPLVAKNLQREKELETEHRGEQYVRAIRLYYRRYRTYPPSMAALENTNNVRFLRKQYIDPLTGKADWRIIHVGENKTTVKGFFGEPLGGLNTTGAGGLGSASTLGSGFSGSASPTTGMTSTIGATSGLAAGFQGATIGGSSSTAGSSTASGSTKSSTGGTSDTDSDSSGGLGQIMGVGTPKTGPSVLNPNGQSTYQTWEFIYDPRIELMYQKSNILGGGMTSQAASSFGSDAVSGKPNSSSGLGSSSGPGSTNSTTSPTSPSSPTTPSSPNSPFGNSPF